MSKDKVRYKKPFNGDPDAAPIIYKGVRYWPNWHAARKVAQEAGLTRIIGYERGWAVQTYISGPYL